MNHNPSSHTSSEQPSNTYPSSHWNSRSGQRMPYTSSGGNYYPTTQGSPPVSPTMPGSPYPSTYPYSATNAQPSGMTAQQGYHSASRHSPYQSPVTNSQHSHSHNVSPSSLPYPSQNGISSSDPRSGYTHSRSMSLPQQPYPAPSLSSHAYGSHDSQQPQMMVQGIDQMQYPASPQRPFACDMCALSFNRQHDLKRHRETHSGEKPFLCNGGCGKTFTRKDALKRHQVRRSSYRILPAYRSSFAACEKVWLRGAILRPPHYDPFFRRE
jgi:uncharacterized Zn-finger protein